MMRVFNGGLFACHSVLGVSFFHKEFMMRFLGLCLVCLVGCQSPNYYQPPPVVIPSPPPPQAVPLPGQVVPPPGLVPPPVQTMPPPRAVSQYST